MNDIVVSVSCFVFSWVVHVCCHRILLRFGIKRFRIVMIYLVGFVGLLGYHFVAPRELFLSSSLLYWGLSSIAIIFYQQIAFENITPTMVLLQQLYTHSRTQSQLLSVCSDDELIDVRLINLEQAGLITRRGYTYLVTAKGQLFAKTIGWYVHTVGVAVGG